MKKLAEHGGFANDDTTVIMLVSNPGFKQTTIYSPVKTAQVAPTILALLGLNPNALVAVQEDRRFCRGSSSGMKGVSSSLSTGGKRQVPRIGKAPPCGAFL
jgi:hypothetical protein